MTRAQEIEAVLLSGAFISCLALALGPIGYVAGFLIVVMMRDR